MNLLGLLLLSLTISLSTTSCGDKDEKKDDKEENKKSNENSGNENSVNMEEKSGNWPKALLRLCENEIIAEMDDDLEDMRAAIPSFPSIEEIAKCACEAFSNAMPNVTDETDFNNIDMSGEEAGMLIIDCMGDEFKELMKAMGGGM